MSFLYHDFYSSDPEGGGSHRLSYYAWGPQDAVRTVFCAHGITRNARDFDFLAEALAAEGLRVICPDIAGRGRSEWLKRAEWYNYAVYLADIRALMQHLALTHVDWIGTSMGGLIGMMLAAQAPESIHSLIINDIGPFIPGKALHRIGSYAGTTMSFPGFTEAEQHLKQIMRPFGITQESHWEHLLQYSFVYEEEGACRFAYDPNIGKAFRTKRGKVKRLPDMEFWELWEKVQCPVLVLRGAESDVLLPEIADRMRARPNVSGVVEWPGVGHAPSLMEPAHIKVICDWLRTPQG